MATAEQTFKLPLRDELDLTIEFGSKVVSDVNWYSSQLAFADQLERTDVQISQADVGRLLLFVEDVRNIANDLLKDAAEMETAVVRLYKTAHEERIPDYEAYKRRMRGLYERYLSEQYPLEGSDDV